MVKDRTTEFKELSKRSGNVFFDRTDVTLNATNGGTSRTQQPLTTLQDFLTAINDVRGQIGSLRKMLEEIISTHARILSATSGTKDLTNTLNGLVERFRVLSKEVSSATKKIDEEAKKSVYSDDVGVSRIKKNQATSIGQDVAQLLFQFNKEQMDYKEKCQKRINNYLNISGIHMPEDEIDAAIESGQLFNTVSVVMGEQEKKRLFEDIKSRHDDIIKLERSVRELADMFQDISLLVEAQGEMVDRIDRNVDNAREYAQAALKNVEEARKARNRAMRLKIAIGLCVAITLIILFIFLLGTFCVYLPFICR